jgi:hypothetical protein
MCPWSQCQRWEGFGGCECEAGGASEGQISEQRTLAASRIEEEEFWFFTVFKHARSTCHTSHLALLAARSSRCRAASSNKVYAARMRSADSFVPFRLFYYCWWIIILFKCVISVCCSYKCPSLVIGTKRRGGRHKPQQHQPPFWRALRVWKPLGLCGVRFTTFQWAKWPLAAACTFCTHSVHKPANCGHWPCGRSFELDHREAADVAENNPEIYFNSKG